MLRQLLTEVYILLFCHITPDTNPSLVVYAFHGTSYYCSYRSRSCYSMFHLIVYLPNKLTLRQALIRDGPELWQMLVGSEDKAHKEELA
jgi:hypothetical protein